MEMTLHCHFSAEEPANEEKPKMLKTLLRKSQGLSPDSEVTMFSM
jgi:hypothetical protein